MLPLLEEVNIPQLHHGDRRLPEAPHFQGCALPVACFDHQVSHRSTASSNVTGLSRLESAASLDRPRGADNIRKTVQNSGLGPSSCRHALIRESVMTEGWRKKEIACSGKVVHRLILPSGRRYQIIGVTGYYPWKRRSVGLDCSTRQRYH